MTDKIRTFHN